MRILFIGGNGNISWFCVKKAISAGFEVWALNRNQTPNTRRAFPPDVKRIIADITNANEVKKAICDMYFDCVCDFICYDENRARAAIDIFSGHTDQYIFISSEAVYKRFSGCYPFTESSERYTPEESSGYIHDKVCAENVFYEAHEKSRFPVTVVRPGYTYDTIMPVSLGYNCFTIAQTVIEKRFLPIMGTGENLWSPLHSSDFAEAFLCLIGNKAAIGKAFQITGTELISVNQMAQCMISALGVSNVRIKHFSVEELSEAGVIKDFGIASQYVLDFSYDNTAISNIADGWKQTVDFKSGIRQTVKWFLEKQQRQRITLDLKQKVELLYNRYYNE